MDDVLKAFDLESQDLEFICPSKIRGSIAGELIKNSEWSHLVRELDVSDKGLDSIHEDRTLSPEGKAVAALNVWAEEKGREATCLKLAEALHARIKTNTLESLCKKVKDHIKLQSAASVGPTTQNIAVSHQPPNNLWQQKATRRSEIKMLEDEFDEIHEKLVNELKSGKQSVEKILWKLTKLRPHAVKKMYDNTIQKMLPDLEKNDTVNALFRRLNPLFTFIDYELLEHLISEFGSQNLKHDMSSYVRGLKLFKKEATVGDLIDYWPGHRIADEDGYFKKLMTKFEGDPYNYTLEKLDNFKLKYCSELRLSEFISVFILECVKETMSFYAVWHIPAVIVPDVIEAARHVDSSFYAKEGVVIVSLDGNLLYPHFTKSLSSAARFPELSESSTKTSSMKPQQQKQQWSLPALQSLQLPRWSALPKLKSRLLPLFLADTRLGQQRSQSSLLPSSLAVERPAPQRPRSSSLPPYLAGVRAAPHRPRSSSLPPSLAGVRAAPHRPRSSSLTPSLADERAAPHRPRSSSLPPSLAGVRAAPHRPRSSSLTPSLADERAAPHRPRSSSLPPSLAGERPTPHRPRSSSLPPSLAGERPTPHRPRSSSLPPSLAGERPTPHRPRSSSLPPSLAGERPTPHRPRSSSLPPSLAGGRPALLQQSYLTHISQYTPSFREKSQSFLPKRRVYRISPHKRTKVNVAPQTYAATSLPPQTSNIEADFPIAILPFRHLMESRVPLELPSLPQGPLRISDLDNVHRVICEAESDWYSIGSFLNISHETLETIREETHSKTSTCLREMLKVWLRMTLPQPTWTALARALTNCGYRHIVEKLSL